MNKTTIYSRRRRRWSIKRKRIKEGSGMRMEEDDNYEEEDDENEQGEQRKDSVELKKTEQNE